MTKDMELEKLRTSLVRIAQAVGLELADFPPIIGLQSFDFDHLVEATKRERGWNALAARIVGKIEDERIERLAHGKAAALKVIDDMIAEAEARDDYSQDAWVYERVRDEVAEKVK